MAALEQHRRSEQWGKEDGRYISHPTTWLNQERWNDELTVVKNLEDKKCKKCGTTKSNNWTQSGNGWVCDKCYFK